MPWAVKGRYVNSLRLFTVYRESQLKESGLQQSDITVRSYLERRLVLRFGLVPRVHRHEGGDDQRVDGA